MRILIANTEFEDREYSSSLSLIQAFRGIGHEVITCGAKLGNFKGELLSQKDIKVYDRETHPETYTYDEVLQQCDKTPDLILQIDPHFYFIGNKPKDIKSAYYIVDVHRGAEVFRKMAVIGRFDYVFIAQKYFMPHFERGGLNCYWLPRAYNDNYIKEYDDIDIECDISFCGETGIGDVLNTFNKTDTKLGLDYHNGEYELTAPEFKYRSWSNHTMEYAERAEILTRLSRDFNLRVYNKSYGPKYAQALCRGKIVVNHSLWKDSALRNFEVLACNRFLIADYLPFQEELLLDKVHYRSYNQSFKPCLKNFDLEYEEIKGLIDGYLYNDNKREEIVDKGNDLVKKYHTFKHRAQTIIDTINGKCDGYTKPY